MRTLISFIMISSVSILSACTLLVEIKDPPDDNVNNTNNQSCGNGRREGSEQCDRQDFGGATCETLVFRRGVLSCNGDCTFNTEFCQGEPVEVCDDGLDNDGDGATDCDDSDCATQAVCQGECGNNVAEGAEACDGSDLRNETCVTLGYNGGTLGCMPNTCEYDRSGCEGSVCGDDWVSGDEECDGNNLNGTSCSHWGFYAGTLSCHSTQCKLDFSGCTGNTGLNNPIQVEAGDDHTCARLSSNEILCWGSDQHGQVGIASGQRFQPVPVRLSYGGNWLQATDLSAGGRHACAVSAGFVTGGKVLCWGDNFYGQLGDGTNTGSAIPVLTNHANPAGTNFTAVSAGHEHTCALKSDRKVWCWGSNTDGQLGVGSSFGTSVNTPTEISLLTHVIAISAGHRHTCAIQEITPPNRTLYCWGSNSNGQLGLGSGHTGATDVPTAVTLSNPRAVSCGQSHTCAIIDGDDVYCWGDNSSGQMGTGSTESAIPLTLDFQAFTITAGTKHTCATQGATGITYCWGNNTWGQLGLGDTVQKNSPTVLIGLNNVTSISGGGKHTCAVGQRAIDQETDCTDGADNDGDGAMDCHDSDCYFHATCTGNENTQPLCSDGIDNDLDGKIDCNDPDCFSMSHCIGAELCSNSIDDDGDGLMDCADPICYNDPMCIMIPIQVKCWGGNGFGQLGNASTMDEYYPITVAGQ